LFIGVIGLSATPAFPQAARGTLNVTIVDPSGAVIAGATVVVTGTEDVTKAATQAPVQTSSQGIATISGLAPGRYTVEGSFPGFEPRLAKDVRVRAGENKQVLLLPIAGLKDAVEIVADSSPRPGDPEVLVGDSTKLRKGLGWEPEIPLATSLVETLDSYRARVPNVDGPNTRRT